MTNTTRPLNRRSPATYTGWILGAALALFAGALALGVNVPELDQRAWPHFAALGILVATGAEGLHSVRKDRRRKRYEASFPDFLRSLATNHASGLTMAASLRETAKGDYGALQPELRRMTGQLSFNAPLTDVLEEFSNRVQSPLITRSMTLIRDAIRSGARTVEALQAAASDAARIKELDETRQAQLSQYVAIVYVAFAVFLMVIVILAKYFVGTVFSGEDVAPEENSVASVFTNPQLQGAFETLFIWAGTVSGAGSGFVIGALLRGRPLVGLHHSFVLCAVGYLVTVAATL